jgi:hypothetical protein
VDVLVFQIKLCCRYFGLFCLGDFWGYFFEILGNFFSNLLVTLLFEILGDFFFKSSGHPVANKVRQNEPDNLTLRGCSDDGDLIFKPLHLPGLQTEQCDFFQEDNKREN